MRSVQENRFRIAMPKGAVTRKLLIRLEDRKSYQAAETQMPGPALLRACLARYRASRGDRLRNWGTPEQHPAIIPETEEPAGNINGRLA
jgi:hypothetical protein